MLATVRKALAALFIGVLGWFATSYSDGKIEASEWANLASVAAVALGVYLVPNKDSSANPGD